MFWSFVDGAMSCFGFFWWLLSRVSLVGAVGFFFVSSNFFFSLFIEVSYFFFSPLLLCFLFSFSCAHTFSRGIGSNLLFGVVSVIWLRSGGVAWFYGVTFFQGPALLLCFPCHSHPTACSSIACTVGAAVVAACTRRRGHRCLREAVPCSGTPTAGSHPRRPAGQPQGVTLPFHPTPCSPVLSRLSVPCPWLDVTQWVTSKMWSPVD